MELQLNISRLLLESGYKLVLVYRGNKVFLSEKSGVFLLPIWSQSTAALSFSILLLGSQSV